MNYCSFGGLTPERAQDVVTSVVVIHGAFCCNESIGGWTNQLELSKAIRWSSSRMQVCPDAFTGSGHIETNT